MSSYCDMEMREKFDKILNENKLVVVSSTGCPPCKKIKKLFKDNSINFHETDITNPDNEDLFYCIYEKSKSRFVPQIFHNANYIGGYTEGLSHFLEGKFNKI
jgi:glutaredoxin